MTEQKAMHTFNIGEDYDIPTWSSKPKHKYFLEIIKNGVPYKEIDVSYKPFILLGKYPDLCDIVLEHMTISRKHAIIQHKNNGEVYLYDLGSSHGTFVNNKKLPGKVYHKLHPFDSIKFAQSTRFYILRCLELEEKDQEEQMQSDGQETKKEVGTEGIQPVSNSKEVLGDSRIRSTKELKELYLKLREDDPYYKMQTKAHKLQGGPGSQEGNKGGEGISWGMSDEQEVYEYQDESQIALIPDLLRRLPNLSEKQVEKIDRYEERLNKYRGSEQEMQQLITKEQKEFGLEDRLKVRKETLMAKMLEIQANLDQAEATVRHVIFGETGENDDSKKKRTFSKYEASNDFDDDEDFFDKTKKKIHVDQDEKKKAILGRIEHNTESYWALKQKLEKLIGKRHELNLQVLNLNQKKDKESGEGSDEDELEVFMKETNEKLVKETREKLFKEIRDHNSEIQMVSEMLQYIKPDTEIDFEGYEKSLGTAKSVFNNDDDEEDGYSLVQKASIVKDSSQKTDRVGEELNKLREIKQRREEQEKLAKKKKQTGQKQELDEDDVMDQVQAELRRQKKQEKGSLQYQQYQQEFAQDGEDAPLFVENASLGFEAPQKKVYAVSNKPQDRNVKNSKDQDACVDLTYMETMEKFTDSYNQSMDRKFGY